MPTKVWHGEFKYELWKRPKFKLIPSFCRIIYSWILNIPSWGQPRIGRIRVICSNEMPSEVFFLSLGWLNSLGGRMTNGPLFWFFSMVQPELAAWCSMNLSRAGPSMLMDWHNPSLRRWKKVYILRPLWWKWVFKLARNNYQAEDPYLSKNGPWNLLVSQWQDMNRICLNCLLKTWISYAC